MNSTNHINGMIIPMNISDIDTDIIIPAQYLTSTSQKGYGQFAFSRLRDDPTFVLNQKQYKGAPILITGSNFGCGSSREHAVWAIQELGIQAIIAPSFADIFANNAKKNGLLLIELDEIIVNQLSKQAIIKELKADINVSQQSLVIENKNYQFNMDSFFKHCLMKGLDELDYLMDNIEEIKQFKQQQINHTLFISQS